MSVRASEVLKMEIKPFLYGVLYSRIMPPGADEIPEEFFIYTNFRSSKAVYRSDFDFIKYAPILQDRYNYLSGHEKWKIHSVTQSKIELRFHMENDLNISSTQFYNLIYRKLMNEQWLHTYEFNEEKKEFIRGYMEPRGSVDTTRRLIAQDYFYNNNFELKRAQVLTDMMNIPISYANFNPRNLQKQFVTGENKRNAQFRINLFYYARNIGFVNAYKALVFEKAYNIGSHLRYEKNDVIFYNVDVPRSSSNVNFIKHLNFFTNYIYDTELTDAKIKALRKELGLSDEAANSGEGRDRSIIQLFEMISEDKCALCDTTETFVKKSTGRQAFEIHHMVPFHNGKEYDNIANLVKLCPTCHGSLKRGRSTKEVQTKNIITILHKKPEVFEYASSTLGIEDIHELADEIWSMLG